MELRPLALHGNPPNVPIIVGIYGSARRGHGANTAPAGTKCCNESAVSHIPRLNFNRNCPGRSWHKQSCLLYRTKSVRSNVCFHLGKAIMTIPGLLQSLKDRTHGARYLNRLPYKPTPASGRMPSARPAHPATSNRASSNNTKATHLPASLDEWLGSKQAVEIRGPSRRLQPDTTSPR